MQSTFRIGDRGPAVVQICEILHRVGVLDCATAEEYDHGVELAVRAFQQQRGLSVDGEVGPATYRRLDEARWQLGDRILTHRPGRLLAGDDVYALQQRLLELGFDTGRVDGRFGASTEAALREFQHNLGLPADGTCGPATLKALGRLSPIVRGGEPNTMRMHEQIRAAGPQLSGKVVVIDAVRDGLLPDHLQAEGARITADLARRIEGRLVAIGVQAFLSAPVARPEAGHRAGQLRGDGPDEPDRADFANRTDADLLLSLAVDSSDHPEACGVSTFYFGSDSHGTVSVAGERFASLAQRELVARTDLVDLRCHPKSWDLLRHTRMPAVRVDVGYLTNHGDRMRLADPGFRDVLAEALVVAIQRFYLSPEADVHTGLLTVRELRAGLAALERDAGLT